MTQMRRMTAEFYLTLRMTNGRKQKKGATLQSHTFHNLFQGTGIVLHIVAGSLA